MLVLVGNSPSSGSTLLADLLDSTPFTACGNELNFWSNKYLYDFDKFKKNPHKFSNTHQLTSTAIFPHYRFLSQYGIEKKLWHKWINESENVQEFSSTFSKHFLSYRQKDKDGIVFEKSPENINTIEVFLAAFPDSYFINIIRDPLYVYASCLKRGFGNYISAINWMIDSAVVKEQLSNPNFIQIKYEDLVVNPFEIVSEIIQKISGRSVSADELKECYQSNNYKKRNSNKIKSWEISQYGDVKNANQKELDPKVIENFSAVSNYRISDAYAKMFGIKPISYKELAEFFEYHLPPSESSLVKKNMKDYRKLSAKSYRMAGLSRTNFETTLKAGVLI